MKDLLLLAIRLYFGINLLYVAQQGGLAKFNWGAENVADNVIVKLGFPFTEQPLLFAYLVIAAEFGGSISLITGAMTNMGATLIMAAMAVATYAHLVVWKDDLDSVIYNENNVHGCALYLVGATVISLFGPGSYSVDAMLFGKRKQKVN